MKTNVRLGIYLAVALTLLAVFVVAPGAWAQPLQTRQGQTVPSRTPTQLAGATAIPTTVVATPRPGDPPANTPVPPTDIAPGTTAIPGATAAPGVAGTPAPPAASGPLTLVMAANRSAAWPGANVVFTLTLTNTSAASVRQVRLEDVLPAGLEPGAIQGTDATWDGRTLRAQRAVLPPGGRLTVVFAARVAADVPAGGVIVNQAVATAGAGASPSARVTAAATLILPPLELPPTGRCLGGA